MHGRIRTSRDVAGITPQQIRAMQKNGPTPNDILENEEFAKELHEEVVGTYNQKRAAEYAASDKDLVQLGARPLADTFDDEDDDFAPITVPTKEAPVADLDLPDEAELEAQLAAVKARKAAAAQEAARRAEEEASRHDEVAADEADPESVRVKTLRDMLAKLPGAPNEAQIRQLKSKYGDSVYVIAFTEEEIFLFTHLRRGQLQKIQQIVSEQSSQEGFNQDPEEALKEKVLQHCILWPRPLTMEFWINSRAGIVDALYQDIMMHSMVLGPQQVLMITAQL